MKKIKLLSIAILISIFFSCTKTEDPIEESISKTEDSIDESIYYDPIDDPIYYDHDVDCDDHIDHGGGCGDVDGRILVTPGKSYNYTFNTYKRLTPDKLQWSTSNSDIELVAGQGTITPTFKFSEKFTTGKIILKVDLLTRETAIYTGDMKLIFEVSKINLN